VAETTGNILDFCNKAAPCGGMSTATNPITNRIVLRLTD
jgi:hypothetical protein